MTIGQAPRVDLTPDMKCVLGDSIEIVEKGALDNLTLQEINSSVNLDDGNVLVSRMSNGAQVRVTKKYVLPKVIAKISELEAEGINVIFLACTAEFPSIECKSILVKPQTMLDTVVGSIAKNRVLGIIIPDELQIENAKKRWSDFAREVIVEAASPYADTKKITETAERLKNSKVDIVIMDCIGYTLKNKETIFRNLRKPVILARSISAKILSELL